MTCRSISFERYYPDNVEMVFWFSGEEGELQIRKAIDVVGVDAESVGREMIAFGEHIVKTGEQWKKMSVIFHEDSAEDLMKPEAEV